MSTQYSINPYIHGINGFGLLFCDTIYTATLGASTEATITIPGFSAIGGVNATTTPKFVAVFSYEAAKNIYVALNQTAAVPSGTSFAASTSELNPAGKLVKAGDVIHVISADATVDVSVAIYTIQE